jgi:hypothetical protein
MAEGSGEWVKKDAFVMPLLPASLKIDPVFAALLHVSAFLELSGDEAVHPDWAVEALEHVCHYLQQLPAERQEELRKQVGWVAEHARKKKWNAGAVEFFAEFPENFDISEDQE